MKMSYLISPSWIQATSDRASFKPMSAYLFCISTIKARYPPRPSRCSLLSQQQLDHREKAVEQVVDLIHVDDGHLCDL